MKLFALVVCGILLLALAKASPYNKYGRSCKDILCIAGQEECVMEQDACTAYNKQCGNYPTCKRKAGANKRGCASIKCDPGHFCSIRQENCARPPCEIKPVCIAFRSSATSSSASSVLSKPKTNTYNSYGSQFGANSQSGRPGQTYGGSSQYGRSGQQYGQREYGGSSQYGGSNQNGGSAQRTSWSWGR